MQRGDRIIVAAVKNHDGKIYIGARHTQAYTNFYVNTGRSVSSSQEDGFMTADGRFLNREEAYILAVETDQTNQRFVRNDKAKMLYSEDLR